MPLALKNLDGLKVKSRDGSTMTLDDLLKKTYTDSFVVVKDGKIVYEKYYNGQNARTRHQMMSVTKSISSTAIRPLIEAGKIDPEAKVSRYVPELKSTAWGDATVQQVLDMTVALDYDEEYHNSHNNDSTEFDFNGYLRSIRFTHDQYQAPANNVSAAIGADRDAYILMDQNGVPYCGAGLNATARDLAKLGIAMANDGKLVDRQLVSPEFIKTLESGGPRQAYARSHYAKLNFMKDWTYKDQWWIRNNTTNAFSTIGIYGQLLYFDPTENIVVVKQTSRKVVQNSDNGEMFNAIDAIIDVVK